MKFKNQGLRKVAPVFLIIALILVFVGVRTDDYFWYIRAGIFTVGAGVSWWLN